MVGGQLSLSLVRNANKSGSDLKETVRSAILHLQETETGKAVTQRLVANERDVRGERRRWGAKIATAATSPRTPARTAACSCAMVAARTRGGDGAEL